MILETEDCLSFSSTCISKTRCGLHCAMQTQPEDSFTATVPELSDGTLGKQLLMLAETQAPPDTPVKENRAPVAASALEAELL